MRFSKYHGAGNDFIITNNMDLTLGEKSEIARKVCHRHFGIGADGFIAAEPSSHADVKMAFYNSDGSPASMCGNGIRCFARFVWDNGILEKKSVFTVETGDGVKRIDITRTPEVVPASDSFQVKVLMGSGEDVKSMSLDTVGEDGTKENFTIYSLHLGVPHIVVFHPEQPTATFDAEYDGNEDAYMSRLNDMALNYGSPLEHDPSFPHGTNVNFVRIVDCDHILCSTWERGAGKTLACGTGACSAALISHLEKNCLAEIRVDMPGGTVVVTADQEMRVSMEGGATFICSGEVAL